MTLGITINYISGMTDIIERIRHANPNRRFDQLARRLLKLGEEKGEAAEAFLSVTSQNNSKEKTWDDFREEIVDCAIVALDLLWMELPDEEGWSPEKKREVIDGWFDAKLNKWAKKRDTGDCIDSVK